MTGRIIRALRRASLMEAVLTALALCLLAQTVYLVVTGK